MDRTRKGSVRVQNFNFYLKVDKPTANNFIMSLISLNAYLGTHVYLEAIVGHVV